MLPRLFCIINLCFLIVLTFNSYSQSKSFSVNVIEKDFAKVSDSLYACRYETSNREYNIFLTALSEKDSVLFTKCRVDSSGWDKRPLVYQEPPTFQFYHKHPAFADYPVVNVSYEGANEYCKWLTGIYNNDPQRKFKKVIFVLPSVKDWEFAAQGGRSNLKHPLEYPWGNNYSFQDKKGMFLCNYKHISDAFITSDSLGNPVLKNETWGYYIRDNRGSFYTTPVKFFNPNSLGLYNMSGNVAEMTLEKSYTMGGSWNSYGGEVTTTSMKQYQESSPEVGFRVFMKVIEY